MPTESNCLTHDSPHGEHGWCVEYRRLYDAVPMSEDGWGKSLPWDLHPCSWRDDRWHEPHEDVIGIQRTDDLLERTDEALARRLIMCVIGKAFHDALMVGNPAPNVERLHGRFREGFGVSENPFQPGDLVIETTTLYGGDRRESWDRGFGIYITDRWEWASSKEEIEKAIEEERAYYAEHPDEGEFVVEEHFGPRSTDHAYYVQYDSNPEAVCRWTNCSFAALPTSYEALAELEPQFHGRTETGGVVFTRDSLLGSLADTGFSLGTS